MATDQKGGNSTSGSSIEKTMSKVPSKYGNPVQSIKLPSGKIKNK